MNDMELYHSSWDKLSPNQLEHGHTEVKGGTREADVDDDVHTAQTWVVIFTIAQVNSVENNREEIDKWKATDQTEIFCLFNKFLFVFIFEEIIIRVGIYIVFFSLWEDIVYCCLCKRNRNTFHFYLSL